MLNKMGFSVKNKLYRIRTGSNSDFKVESKVCSFYHLFHDCIEIVHRNSFTIYSFIGRFSPSWLLADLKDQLVSGKFHGVFQELGDKIPRVIQSFTHNLEFARLFLPFGYLEYPHETISRPCSFAESIDGKDKKLEDNNAKENSFSAGYLSNLGSLDISIEECQPSNAKYGMVGESATPPGALLEALGTHLADSLQTMSFSSNRKRKAFPYQKKGVFRSCQ
ncbi:hypothetical protein V6N12_002173 [Hibiscus sabdariffa]|uniref:Uncharacterized protein n=1 Tax=Hibiscus sabdariffa TaxID=183260 RepID=A0ABR2BIG0_9ROSI